MSTDHSNRPLAMDACSPNKRYILSLFSKALLVLLILVVSKGYAQWDANSTVGTTGYNDYGAGVVQLLNTANNGCVAAAVHETSVTYDPSSGTPFSKCYQVFFGCPGSDEIGSDTKGDGMAFSFWRNSATYNIGNGLACGGGLGYMGSASDGKMITIEFDTWNSQGNSGFDNTYEGTGNQDQIALHRDGVANEGGKVVGANPGNLEDGLEHTVCIAYDPATDIYTVTIDGTTVFSYDATGTGYELENYFAGNTVLNQSWSSGKNGATNPTTVSAGTDITDQIGAPLCPAGVTITSPSAGSNFGGCPVGPITINATAVPPAGNTVQKVEFMLNGTTLIGTDNTANYSITWGSPTTGTHSLTAVAYYTPSGTTSTSTAVSITVGANLQMTSSAPTIDGTVDGIWGSYPSLSLTKGFNSSPDLAGSYKLMYDATNLYVLVNVTDDDLRNDSPDNWNDDGVEVFIDIGNKKMGSYQGTDYQYSFEYNSTAVTEYKHGTTAGVTVGRSLVAGGYVMEYRFPWATLGGTPTAGTYIGFDVKVNDDDSGADTRDNELGWNDASFTAWSNPSTFGSIQFSSCNPLPVELISFTGELVGEVVILNWVTATEINNDRFIIQRSTDLISWESLGTVKGGGTHSGTIPYSFPDVDPQDGINYYRLIQVDIDGTASYSHVVAVNLNAHNVFIGPNPFDDVLIITSALEGDHVISVYDALGRLLYQTTSKVENGVLEIHPDLASGAYVVTIQTEAVMEQVKVIKK